MKFQYRHRNVKGHCQDLGVGGNIPISGTDNSEWRISTFFTIYVCIFRNICRLMSFNNLLIALYYLITYVFPHIYYLWFLGVGTNDVQIVCKLVGFIQS